MSDKFIYPTNFWRHPIHWLAMGLGSGACPKAPGTVGTLAAIPIYWILLKDLSPVNYLLVLVLTSLAGIYFCEKASKALGIHDFGGIVWDEFVGFWITMWLAPAGWAWLLVGFLLFRFFDIVKPWPIGWLDKRVSGGVGIMVDDIIAGIFAWVVLQSLQLGVSSLAS